MLKSEVKNGRRTIFARRRVNSNKRPLRHLGNGMFHFDEGVLPTEVHSRKGKDVLERGTLLRSRPRSFRGGEVNPFDALRRDSNNSAHTTLTKSRGKKRGFFVFAASRSTLESSHLFCFLPPSKQAVFVHRVASSRKAKYVQQWFKKRPT